MGSKSAGPGAGGMPQGGDVPAFDLPPAPPPGGGRQYTPEEWSRNFGPNVDPDPSMIRQGPQGGHPMMGADPRTWSPFNLDGSPVQQPQRDVGYGNGEMPRPMPVGGQGPAPQMSNDDYLRQLYGSELGREADRSGMDFWRQQMNNGMSRDQIRQAFDQSQEGQGYNQRIAPMVDDFGRGRSEMPSGTPDDFINRVYQSQLGRAPDQGGMDYWRGQMAQGMHPRQVQEMIMRSQEAEGRNRGPQFNAPPPGMFGPQMDPQVADALRLAHQGQRPQSQPSQGIDQAQIAKILGGLGGMF